MFDKISIQSFTYDLTKIFFFPNKNMQEIYEKYLIEKVYLYSVLMDTDSVSSLFSFCKPKCDLPDSQFRDVLFEVIKANRILERFLVTIAMNPKGYSGFLKSKHVNKKHKNLRKAAPGMEFKDYAKRINFVKEIETFGQLPKEKQKQGKFSLKNNEMVLEGIEKSTLSQINNKTYYFSDGIVPLPFSHTVLYH